jgi:polysaccharide pyruvyl transferase WcaK-like protein
MKVIKTLENMASHGAWRVQHDRGDLIPAVGRLAAFTAEAARKAIERKLVGLQHDYIVHAAIHTTGNNIGDMALPLVIRKAIDIQLGEQNWYLQPLWKSIDNNQVKLFNERAKLMIVGGGGLFLRDNKPSGWQWNINYKNLSALQTPFCLFAVGYNRFRDEPDFDNIFKEHVHLTAEKAIFVGLRNTESLERLAEYLPTDLRSKLRVQPCVTTVLSKFYPTYKSELRRPYAKELAINAAFDRPHLRFGDNGAAVHSEMQKLARVAKWAHMNGWIIHLTYHSFEDSAFAEYLDRDKVPYRRYWLPRMNPEAVFDLYTKIPLVIGMRGHAQMIPFGLGNMIIPVITHNKLIYMLKEFGFPEWGVELASESAVSDVIDRIVDFDSNRDSYYERINKSVDRMWKITKSNIYHMFNMAN